MDSLIIDLQSAYTPTSPPRAVAVGPPAHARPATGSRASTSAAWRLTHKLDDAKSKWFAAFPGQVTALAALRPKLGTIDPQAVDFVQHIDDVGAFFSEYLVPNRPVVVGAGASDALIGDFTDRVAKKMSRKKLSKITASVEVGRVPCKPPPVGGTVRGTVGFSVGVRVRLSVRAG